MSIDPVVSLAIQIFLGTLLVYGGFEKLVALQKFEAVIHGYRILPTRLVRLVAVTLPVFETLSGLLLLSGFAPVIGVWVAVILLVTVTAAVIVNLVRGNVHINCGCGGLSETSTISWFIPCRNLILISAALMLLMSKQHRELTLLDQATTAGFVLGLSGIYLAMNLLMSNSPLLKSHRRVK